MSLKFGTDGVRAEAFTVLTTEYVAALANAAAQVLGGGQWLIGRDTRESGPAFEAALAAGLAAGCGQPVSLGVVPTPALAWLAAQRGVPAAMITASIYASLSFVNENGAGNARRRSCVWYRAITRQRWPDQRCILQPSGRPDRR